MSRGVNDVITVFNVQWPEQAFLAAYRVKEGGGGTWRTILSHVLEAR